MQQVLINHLLDIVIAVISLAVIFSSFFKPTFRYVRHLVGVVLSFIAMFALKTVKFFNIVEVYIGKFFDRIHFRNAVEAALKFIGEKELPTAKIDTIYSLVILLIVGLVVFVVVNLIMGASHSSKVKRANKRGDYVYNSPIGSFVLSIILVVIGIVTVTCAFATLPFEIDYVGSSYVMSFVDKVLNAGYNAIKNFIPVFKDFSQYTDIIRAVIA